MTPTEIYQTGEALEQEATAAERVLMQTKTVAAKLAPRLRNQLRRFVHDGYTLADFKRELENFDLRTMKWKRK